MRLLTFYSREDREGKSGRNHFASFHSKICDKDTKTQNEYDKKLAKWGCCWWQGKYFDRQVVGHIPLGPEPRGMLGDEIAAQVCSGSYKTNSVLPLSLLIEGSKFLQFKLEYEIVSPLFTYFRINILVG